MKKINTLLVLLAMIFQSCNDDSCEECFTPPQNFNFEVIDKISGENVFANGTYNPEHITITNSLHNNEPVEFTFISENNMNLIYIGSIGWKTEIVNLRIEISNNHIFNFYVDAERKTQNCCNYTAYKQITVTNSEFNLDTQTGVYKIFVE